MKLTGYFLSIIFLVFASGIFNIEKAYAAAPAAPSNLTATAVSGTQIDLAWQDNSADETSFWLEYNTTGPSSSFSYLANVSANVTAYQHKNLTIGTTYYYRVKAYNAYGYSACTDVASAKAQYADAPNPQWIAQTPAVGNAQRVAMAGNYAYLTSNIGLQIIDLTNPSNPLVKSSVALDNLMAVAVGGSYVYAGSSKDLKIINVTDPLKPTLVTSFALADYIFGLTVVGTKLYVAENELGLQIIDVTNPSSPNILGTVDTPIAANAVAVSGTTAVVADSTTIQVVDVAIASAPTIVGSLALTGIVFDVKINNNYAYVAARTNGAIIGGLYVVDIAIRNSPQLKGKGNPLSFGSAVGLAVSGNYVYLASYSSASTANGMQIFYVINPDSPVQTSFLAMPISTQGIAILNNIVSLANGAPGGFATVSVSNPSSPTLLAKLPAIQTSNGLALASSYLYTLSQTNAGSAMYIYNISNPYFPSQVGSFGLETPYALTVAQDVSGNNYAVIGDSKNLKLVRVTDPSSPVLVSTLTLPDFIQGLTAVGNYIYVAESGAGLQIVDISNPSNPSLKGTADTPGSAIAVAVSGTTAVVADATSLQVINVVDASSPSIQGSYSFTTGRAVDVKVNGNYVYVAVSVAGLQIIDITSHTSPQLKGKGNVVTFGSALGVAISGNYAYLASYGTTSDANGLQIFNVADPANPVQTSFNAVGGSASAGKVAVFNNYAYLTDKSKLAFIADLGGAKLTVNKTADKISVTHGEQITYTLTINNPSPTDTMTKLSLSDPIPSLTTYISGSATNGGTYDSGNNKVVWSFPSIGPLATITASFKVNVN